MPGKAIKQPRWFKEVKASNFEAAQSYLALIYSVKRSTKIVAALRKAEPSRFMAKDIFRASQLSRLGISNQRVVKDRKKIKEGIAMSPILLVRDERHGRVIVADGYHRLCAVYEVSEEFWIPCKIV